MPEQVHLLIREPERLGRDRVISPYFRRIRSSADTNQSLLREVPWEGKRSQQLKLRKCNLPVLADRQVSQAKSRRAGTRMVGTSEWKA